MARTPALTDPKNAIPSPPPKQMPHRGTGETCYADEPFQARRHVLYFELRAPTVVDPVGLAPTTPSLTAMKQTSSPPARQFKTDPGEQATSRLSLRRKRALRGNCPRQHLALGEARGVFTTWTSNKSLRFHDKSSGGGGNEKPLRSMGSGGVRETNAAKQPQAIPPPQDGARATPFGAQRPVSMCGVVRKQVLLFITGLALSPAPIACEARGV